MKDLCKTLNIHVFQSLNVALAVYSQNWSYADVRYQKMLILIVERAQKPVQLKATTFVNISRGTMSEVNIFWFKIIILYNTSIHFILDNADFV